MENFQNRINIFVSMVCIMLFLGGCAQSIKMETSVNYQLINEYKQPTKIEDNEVLVYVLNGSTFGAYFQYNNIPSFRLSDGEYTYFKIKKGFNLFKLIDGAFYECLLVKENAPIVFLITDLNKPFIYNQADQNTQSLSHFYNAQANFLSAARMHTNVITKSQVNMAKTASNVGLALSLLTPDGKIYNMPQIIPYEIAISNLGKFKYVPYEYTEKDEYAFNSKKYLPLLNVFGNCNLNVTDDSIGRKFRQTPPDNKALLTFALPSIYPLKKPVSIWNEKALVANFKEPNTAFQIDLDEGKHYFYINEFDILEVNVSKNKHYLINLDYGFLDNYIPLPLNLNDQNTYKLETNNLLSIQTDINMKNILKGGNIKTVNMKILATKSVFDFDIDEIYKIILPGIENKIQLVKEGKILPDYILEDKFGIEIK